MQTLEEEIDLGYLQKSGVIKEHWPVHMPERSHILESWSAYRWRLSRGMLLTGFLNNMQPLNFIRDYYGEKMGFYFAWLIHYTGWLIPVAIIGLVLGVAMIIDSVNEGRNWETLFSSPLNILYSLCIMIWVTLFHESWKRKQNYIANEWLVRGYEDVTQERPQFKSELTIDPDTLVQKKIAVKDAYRTQLLVGVPVSLFFMGLVLCSQLMIVWISREVGAAYKEVGEKTPWYVKYSLGVVNSIFIVIFGNIYGIVQARLVNNENHRYVSGFENSTVNKIYMFQFVNNYIGNFFQIIYNQSFAALSVNVITIMVVKQILLNVMEYLQDKIEVNDRLKKVDNNFKEQIAMAELAGDEIEKKDLEKHCEIEKQLQMKPTAASLVPHYNEAFIQLGFVAFFATAFPFAPLFSLFTNELEIKIKLQEFAKIGRRNIA